jgi:hypothetical protein
VADVQGGEMGASVVAYWPGITDDQIESQPGFYNDDRAWANWMAEREDEPEVLNTIKRLGAEAILTYTTDGMEDEDLEWVSPTQLRDAVRRLREAIKEKRPEAKVILETYERNVNRIDPVDKKFIQDLDDIEAIANWAEAEGAKRMTLAVNW